MWSYAPLRAHHYAGIQFLPFFSLFLFLSRPLFTSDRDRQLDLSITDDSPVYFADYSHDFQSENKGLTPVGLKNIVDLVSFVIFLLIL